ncbi:MAG: hypothetical protein NZT61_07415 [Deltaproteobacteria bacterium]|nr:hypothetical protein [Deltaproteobacteria bacterium]
MYTSSLVEQQKTVHLYLTRRPGILCLKDNLTLRDRLASEIEEAAVWVRVSEEGVVAISDTLFADLVDRWLPLLPKPVSVIGFFFDGCKRHLNCLILPRSAFMDKCFKELPLEKHAVMSAGVLSDLKALRPVIIVNPLSVMTTQNAVCGDKLYFVHRNMSEAGGFIVFDIRKACSLLDLVLVRSSDGVDQLFTDSVTCDSILATPDNKRVVASEMHRIAVCGVLRLASDRIPAYQSTRFYRVLNGQVVLAQTFKDAIDARLSFNQSELSWRPSVRVHCNGRTGYLNYEYFVTCIGHDHHKLSEELKKARHRLKREKYSE